MNSNNESPEVQETVHEDHTGTVVSVAGDHAVVHFVRGSMCAHCGGCLAFGDKEMETVALNSAGAVVGDKVNVGISAKNIVKASLLAYAIPLFALIAGLLIGNLFSEIIALLTGIGLCALSYLILHKLDLGFRKSREFEPVILSVVDQDE